MTRSTKQPGSADQEVSAAPDEPSLQSLTLNGKAAAHRPACPLVDPLAGQGANKLNHEAAPTKAGNGVHGGTSGAEKSTLQETRSRGSSAESLSASSEGLNAVVPPDIEDGAGAAISYGQNDSFTQQLMAGALRLRSSLFKQERVSFSDIAHNPSLAKRARAEMDNHNFQGMIEGLDGRAAEGRPHELEVARLQLSLEGVTNDVREECKVNAQLARLVSLRLDAARRAVERLLGVLQAMTAAEAAYSRAMNAVSKVKLASEFDGKSMKSALTRLSDVPWLIGETHASNQGSVAAVTQSCQEMVGTLRQDSATITHDCQRAQSSVIHARKNLHQAFLAHQANCRAADDLAVAGAKSHKGASVTRVDIDPWLSESRVVAAQQTLHEAQAKQRLLLALACEKVQHHDKAREKAVADIVEAMLKSYRSSLGSDPKEEAGLREAVEKVDALQDLHEFSASAAAALSTGKELAARQQQALDAASQDLLCSPDIIRQGQMARWISGSGKWLDCHFILTRSGFLHWLADPQDVTPLGSLNLPKCNFEAGEAPQFNINEHQGGFFGKSKRMCFEASSVEECCEWAIALRESIAAHKSR